MNTTKEQFRYDDIEYVSPPHGFCSGCSVVLALRYVLKVLGEKVVMIMPPGCASPSVLQPQRSLRQGDQWLDVVTCPFGSTAIFAGGIKSGLVARGDTETEVVGWAGDGATYDIGFGGVSAAAERNEDIIYVCYDNEAYMNTGNQRSGATPWGAKTTTNPPPAKKGEAKKDIMWIMAGHGIPYAATATIAYPEDLMAKAKKVKERQGFRFLNLLTPCVPGWGFSPNQTVKVSKLAVQTRYFPLYEIENGIHITINKNPKPKELKKFIEFQSRFKHLKEAEIDFLQEEVEKRWKRLSHMAEFKREESA